MKRFALSLAVMLGLVGCAAVGPAATYEVDEAKVAAIERAAVTSGVQIYWINKPRKAVAGS